MASEYLEWAFRQRLPCAQKFVLFVMANNGGSDAIYVMGEGHLEERCGLTSWAVRIAIAALEKKHLIYEIAHRRGVPHYGLRLDLTWGKP